MFCKNIHYHEIISEMLIIMKPAGINSCGYEYNSLITVTCRIFWKLVL